MNVPLNTAANPDGQLLFESNSVHLTENEAHQLDSFGNEYKHLGEKKWKTSLFQPTVCSRISKGKNTSFFERIEELKSFCNKHGHANVSEKENSDLAILCCSVGYARQKPKKHRMKLDEECIASLDALVSLTGDSTEPV